jgi:hypothetical protein
VPVPIFFWHHADKRYRTLNGSVQILASGVLLYKTGVRTIAFR